jgi:putative addiction module killer protein
MNGIEIRQYIDQSGRNVFLRWLDTLNDTSQVRIVKALDRIEHGNFSGIKGVGAGVFECRIDFGPGYRIYFGKDGDRIVVLLGGGIKKRQQEDIGAAQKLWKDFKQRKRDA